jgi:dTMP kinase
MPLDDSAAAPTAVAVPGGRFVTIEGIDGAGKTTHVQSMADRWQGQGHEVVRTREPGGTDLAEALRALFLDSDMDGLTEALLVFAARRDHLVKVIEPALARGAVVLCDRFTDATFAYQGAGRGHDLAVLAQLETWVQQGLQPDLTLWFDLPPEVAAARRAGARAADRLEAESVAFFERVAGGYAARAQARAGRFVRIDANQSVGAVAEQVRRALDATGW